MNIITTESDFIRVAKFVTDATCELNNFEAEIKKCSLSRIEEIKASTIQLKKEIKDYEGKFRHLTAPLNNLSGKIIKSCNSKLKLPLDVNNKFL